MFNHLNRFGLLVGIFIVKKKKGDGIFAFTLPSYPFLDSNSATQFQYVCGVDLIIILTRKMGVLA